MLFLSYSRGNLLVVRALAAELRRLGHRTWMDLENLRPGERWRDAIERALADCSAMVYCISRLSVASAWTSVELRAALDRGIPVIPLMVDAVAMDELPAELRALQMVMLGDGSDAASAAACDIARSLPLSEAAGSGAEQANDDALLVTLQAGVDGGVLLAWRSARWASPPAAATPEALCEMGRAAEESQAAQLRIGTGVGVASAALVLGALAGRLARERIRVLVADQLALAALSLSAVGFSIDVEREPLRTSAREAADQAVINSRSASCSSAQL